MAKTEHCLWLLPARPLKERLSSIIQKLATVNDAVDFEPHLTIFSVYSDDEESRSVCHLITKKFEPMKLIAEKLRYSSLFTKSLYIQFFESAELRHLFETIKESFTQPSDYILNPHLSLLYKNMPEAKLKELSHTLDIPLGTYLFDRIKAIETEIPLREPDQIRRWRVVFESKSGV